MTGGTRTHTELMSLLFCSDSRKTAGTEKSELALPPLLSPQPKWQEKGQKQHLAGRLQSEGIFCFVYVGCLLTSYSVPQCTGEARLSKASDRSTLCPAPGMVQEMTEDSQCHSLTAADRASISGCVPGARLSWLLFLWIISSGPAWALVSAR